MIPNLIKEHYPSFVASSGQINCPPGSYETIKTWISNSFLNSSSKVLEIGCSNGFISYQINKYTGAEVIGIDLSEESVKKANENCSGIAGCKFFVGDGGKLNFPDSSFTHVVISGHLPWVNEADRQNHIKEALRVLRPGGFLLTALYYFSSNPPKEFISKFNSQFSTSLKSEYDYAYWNSLFKLSELELEYEANFEVKCPSQERKSHYLSCFDQKDRIVWQNKVNLLDQNGKYISFFIKIFRKDNNPHYRQNPRGGIYTWNKISEKIC